MWLCGCVGTLGAGTLILSALSDDCEPVRVDAEPGNTVPSPLDGEPLVSEVPAVDPEHQRPRRPVVKTLKVGQQSTLCNFIS